MFSPDFALSFHSLNTVLPGEEELLFFNLGKVQLFTSILCEIRYILENGEGRQEGEGTGFGM